MKGANTVLGQPHYTHQKEKKWSYFSYNTAMHNEGFAQEFQSDHNRKAKKNIRIL